MERREEVRGEGAGGKLGKRGANRNSGKADEKGGAAAAAAAADAKAAERARQRLKKKRKRQRADEAPLEVSAKKRPPRVGSALSKLAPPRSRRARDPRFDDMCGEYNESHFRAAYGFLDAAKQEELKEMQAAARKAKDPEERDKLRRVADKYRSEIAMQQRRDRERSERTRVRRQEVRAVEQGKKPFFLKKSDRKKVNLAEQFLELQGTGKLESFMAKRRKKNAAKDRRWVPEVRRGAGPGE